MADLTVPAALLSGEIVALGVSAEEFMEKYAADHHEWVQGAVIKMSPVTQKHDAISKYLDRLLDAYFEHNPIGSIFRAPFVMVLENSRREPDIQVVLNDNPGKLTETAMIGPADICVEIISEESITRDYGSKHKEYQQAGVKEYWQIDPLSSVCQFQRLGENQRYVPFNTDDNGFYESSLLPKFKLHVPTLWQEKLPTFSMVGNIVAEMFTD